MSLLTCGLTLARLGALYEHRSKNQDACGAAADGYVLTSSVGAACLVASELTDTAAQSELVFFTQLFQAKSVHP